MKNERTPPNKHGRELTAFSIGSMIKSLIKNNSAVLFILILLTGFWTTFGREKLNNTIDKRIDLKIEPFVLVLDTTYYTNMETNQMLRLFLKAESKGNIIDESKAYVDNKKRIDLTRKKLGKTKYLIKRIK